MTEIITPNDEAHWLAMRKQDITSTESAALFGMSPYLTAFELWHRKRSGDVPEFKVNGRMKWGNRLEAAIAHGIAEEMGWTVVPLKSYMRDPTLRMGSSFDFQITSFDEPVHLEIKNVDYLAFRDGWIEHEDGTIEAPEHIEMQVQHQMAVSGYRKAFICAFVGGNRFELIERERDATVIAAIRSKVAAFWKTVDANEEPTPLYPDDADMVIALNRYAQPGKIVDASGDAIITSMIQEYREAKVQADRFEEESKILRAKILEHIGDAEKVLADGYTISAGLVADVPPTIITPEMVGQTYGGRKGYRSMRLTAKKQK